jgi:hypothetical protein
MTPTSSSNSSSVNLPRNPSSRGTSGPSLLQERLRERKVESAKARRDSVGTPARSTQSSPLKGREERRPSSSGAGKGLSMGVKQIEEVSCSIWPCSAIILIFYKHVSTLTKQNFNLKLELHHRRERQLALEARLEAAERRIEEQAELQEINDQLLAELEKRDQAVEEAVSIIVNLEEKVERLMHERGVVQAFDTQYESSYSRASQEEQLSSPAPSRSQISSAMARMPSFLSEKSEGAEALRSLYLSSYSDAALPKLSEEAEEASPDELDSPRLSVLSESSFLSVYGDKYQSLDDKQLSLDTEIEEHAKERGHRKSESVERWIDQRPATTQPQSATSRRNDLQFRSINNVLVSPLQRLEKLKISMESSSRLISETMPEQNREKLESRQSLKRTLKDTTSFDTLPPTPDTISTNTLRHCQRSNDTLCQKRVDNGTFRNSTSTYPAPDMTRSTFHSTVSPRPRSAGETVTSRREGHGWDTETQREDISSTASTFATQDFHRPRRVMTPDLFTFASDDRDGPWGRDMMFNHEPVLPSHVAARYERLRHSSMADYPRSDDTVRRVVQRNGNNQNVNNPLDASPGPAPPNRRSSLSATTQIRRYSLSHTSGSSPGNSPAASKQEPPKQEPKKNRFANRLFGRAETSPAPAISQQQKPKVSGRTQTWVDSALGRDEQPSATPPPIRRSRNNTVSSYRPSSAASAGTGMPNHAPRRHSAFGVDGASDETNEGKTRPRKGSVGVAPGNAEETKTGGRKWLGFGKAGSLLRN